MNRRILTVLAFGIFVLSLSCGKVIATLNASYRPEGSTGTQATVNFTDFDSAASVSGGGTTILGFTNPEGDRMEFTLAGETPSGTIALDGVTNKFYATFTAVQATGGFETVEVNAAPGYANTITIGTFTRDANNRVSAVSADFVVQFDAGGAGNGAIRYGN